MTIPTNDMALEKRYRNSFLLHDAISFSLLAGLFIIFNFLLFKVDSRLWPDGVVHYGLIILRIFMIVISASAIYFSIRTREPTISDRWIFGWGIMLALTNIPVIFSRPASYTGNVVPELMAVICLFAVMPDRPQLRIYPPLLLATSSLILLFTIKTLPTSIELISILFSYLIALMMGYRISSALFKHRREAFQAKEEMTQAHLDTAESEQQFRLLIQNSHGIIYSIKPDGSLGFVSPSWTRLLGHQLEQVLGEDFRTFVHPDDIPACEAFLQKTVETGEVQTGVLYRVYHANGTIRWHRSNIIPCYNEKKEIISFVGNAVDETEPVLHEEELRKARNEAEAASRAKSEFLALVSHEIRTPLNALVGFSSLACTTADPGKLSQYHRILHQSARSMMDLLNDILDMSKIEAGRMTLESLPFSLRQLLADLEQQYRPLTDEKQLSLVFDIDPGLPHCLSGDPVRMRQILSNLLSNAVKFTLNGAVSCTVKVSEERGQMQITISDTGIGIPDNKRAYLFQPFQQLDPSITRNFGGTGLGLAIVASLVQMMDGAITLDSREGEGSAFTVNLPMHAATNYPKESTEVYLKTVSSSILIVEDNAYNRLLLQEILSSWGHRTTLAEDGTQALAILELESFDLALLDLRMPGIEGIELAKLIRQRETENGLSPIPIIGVTADADSRTREACMQSGMNEVLSKPVAMDKLATLLASFLTPLVQAEPAVLPISRRASHDLGNDGSRALEFQQILIKELAEEFRNLYNSIEHDDRAGLAISAHSLKGMLSYLEDRKPMEFAAWLQENGKTAPNEELRQVARQLAPFCSLL